MSARLSVNKRSPLPSPSLGLFTLSPSSASCLPHLALVGSPHPRSTLEPSSLALLFDLFNFYPFPSLPAVDVIVLFESFSLATLSFCLFSFPLFAETPHPL